MDLVEHYKAELQHLRGRVNLFARQRPKIAARLGIEEFGCSDPFVERLLQSYGLIAALVQADLSGEFAEIPGIVLDRAGFLTAPTPSMAVLGLTPDPGSAALAKGAALPAGTRLTLEGAKGAAEHRLAGAVRLWPVEITEASFHTQDLGTLTPPRGRPGQRPVIAGTRLCLAPIGRHKLKALPLDTLRVHAPAPLGGRIMRLLMSATAGAFARPAPEAPWRPIGLNAEPPPEAMLAPGGGGSLSGHRLLRESILLPGRMRFFELGALGGVIADCQDRLEVLLLHTERDDAVEDKLDAGSFRLGCALAVNLVERVHRVPEPWSPGAEEIAVERDGESVHQILELSAVETSSGEKVDFRPLGTVEASSAVRCYQCRFPGARPVRQGERAETGGVSLRLVDPTGAPLASEFRQISATLLCSDPAAPVGGQGPIRCEPGENAPLSAVSVVEGPTAPLPPVRAGRRLWKLLGASRVTASRLDREDASAALRGLLALHEPPGRAESLGVAIRSIESRTCVRRLGPGGRPARGREITLDLTAPLSATDGSALLLGKAIEPLLVGTLCDRTWMRLTVTFDGQWIGRFPPRFGSRPVI